MTMQIRTIIGAACALGCSAAVAVWAAPTGVQWTPGNGDYILVNKDVGDQRWAISLTLSNLFATGNVFFTSDQAPSFIACDKTGDQFDPQVGELTLRYSCSGSDRAVGGFALSDWTLINDDVQLPLSFFIPESETCDFSNALNGPNANSATSIWRCSGNAGNFDFQLFANGTGKSSATGEFDFDAVEQACTFGRLGDGSYLDVEYSPSRDHLTVYEIPKEVDSVILSECDREDF
jgi:hypothetical protein